MVPFFRSPLAQDLPGLIALFSSPGAERFTEHFPGSNPMERAMWLIEGKPVENETRRIEVIALDPQYRVTCLGILTWYVDYDDPALGIIVAPEHRGIGLSRRLMWFLLRTAASMGAKTVFLTAHKDNPAAVLLYQHTGFTIESDRGEKWAMCVALNPMLLQTSYDVDVPEPLALLKKSREVGHFFRVILAGYNLRPHLEDMLHALRIERCWLVPFSPIESSMLEKEYNVYANVTFTSSPEKNVELVMLIGADPEQTSRLEAKVLSGGMLCGVGGDIATAKRYCTKRGSTWNEDWNYWWWKK